MTKVHKIEDELRELLEELRVAIPGIQILFGFLLMVPFNQRFEHVSESGRTLFVAALGFTCAASVLLIAPSVYHRFHFRSQVEKKEEMLHTFNHLAIAGTVCLACAIVTSLAFVGGFLFHGKGAALAATLSGLLCLGLWYLLPIWRRSKERHWRQQAMHSAPASR